jgi:hypothetical protein
VNGSGDFELPRYLYLMLNDLMKQSLDMGTLLSSDPAKLRAFRDQTKGSFKRRWMELAQALESFGIIEACGCPPADYCKRCSGSRYLLSSALSADELREVAVVTGRGQNGEITKKLHDGLQKALAEVQQATNG